MKTKEQDLEVVKALTHNEACYVAWSEEGGGEVRCIWDTLFLFSIPQYGGDGSFEKAFRIKDADELVDMAHSWT